MVIQLDTGTVWSLLKKRVFFCEPNLKIVKSISNHHSTFSVFSWKSIENNNKWFPLYLTYTIFVSIFFFQLFYIRSICLNLCFDFNFELRIIICVRSLWRFCFEIITENGREMWWNVGKIEGVWFLFSFRYHFWNKRKHIMRGKIVAVNR